MKSKKTIIVASLSVLAILIGVVIYTIIKYCKEKEDNNSNSNTTPVYDDNTNISYGDKGDYVKQLQSYLNAKLAFYAFEKGGKPLYNGAQVNSLDVDGVYGKKTKCVALWWFGKSTINVNELI